jgi:hypothetical protein
VKRGTPRHPKTTELAIALSIERWGAVGILESLWHFAQEFAKRGDVGRFTDKAIANGIGWSGDHSVIIEALCACHWLDRCPCHRLRIHDWPDHADAGVHNSSEVKSRGLLECYESLPDVPDMIDESCGVQPAMATAKATAQNGNGSANDPVVAEVVHLRPRSNGNGARKGRETWITPYSDQWRARYGGEPAYGPLCKAFKPLVEKHPPELVMGAWLAYLAATGASYASPQKFSQTFGVWALRAEGISEAEITSRREQEEFLRGGDDE